jgi:hypothetical protein
MRTFHMKFLHPSSELKGKSRVMTMVPMYGEGGSGQTNRPYFSTYFSTLKMEAVGDSETLVTKMQITLGHGPEDINLHTCRSIMYYFL